MTILAVAFVGVGLGLAILLGGLRWRRDRWDYRYVEQIQILRSDTPLDLPAVKPLKGRVVKRKRAAAVLRMTRKA